MKWILKNVLIEAAKIQAGNNHTYFAVRDEGLLDSAIYSPLNTFYYNQNADVYTLATDYAFGIIKNHPLIDGNKRMAYITCRLFLLLNSRDIKAEKKDKYQNIVNLAASRISKEEFAMWLKCNSQEV